MDAHGCSELSLPTNASRATSLGYTVRSSSRHWPTVNYATKTAGEAAVPSTSASSEAWGMPCVILATRAAPSIRPSAVLVKSVAHNSITSDFFFRSAGVHGRPGHTYQLVKLWIF
jgi:hypothetical protein